MEILNYCFVYAFISSHQYLNHRDRVTDDHIRLIIMHGPLCDIETPRAPIKDSYLVDFFVVRSEASL